MANGYTPYTDGDGHKHCKATDLRVGDLLIVGMWYTKITAVRHNRVTTTVTTEACPKGFKVHALCDMPIKANA